MDRGHLKVEGWVNRLFFLVNTDLNWSRRSWALILLSVSRLEPCLSGATPMFSCLFDLTYDQKGFVLFHARPSSMVLLT